MCLSVMGCVSDSEKTTATKRQQCNVDLNRRGTQGRGKLIMMIMMDCRKMSSVP